jgi:hypothetical protein
VPARHVAQTPWRRSRNSRALTNEDRRALATAWMLAEPQTISAPAAGFRNRPETELRGSAVLAAVPVDQQAASGVEADDRAISLGAGAREGFVTPLTGRLVAAGEMLEAVQTGNTSATTTVATARRGAASGLLLHPAQRTAGAATGCPTCDRTGSGARAG